MVRKLPSMSSQRPGNRPSVAYCQPLHAQGLGEKPTRQAAWEILVVVRVRDGKTYPAAANARAAANTAGPASLSRPSRSSRAGGTSSSCGFMPMNQACTTGAASS